MAKTSGARKRALRRDKALRTGTTTRKWSRPIAAAATGVVLAGATTAGTLIGCQAPGIDTTVPATQLAASTVNAVCPPAPQLPESSGEEDVDFQPFSSDADHRLATVAVSDLAGNIPGIQLRTSESTQLTESQPEEIQQGEEATGGPDGTAVTNIFADRRDNPDEGQPMLLGIEPLGSQPALAAASSSFTAPDGDLTGLATANCAPATHQQWITGASTEVGTTSVLTVSNPSASPATVDISLYGKAPIDAPGTSGIALAPDESRSFVLGGLAPDEAAVGIEVSSSGGAVSPAVNQYTLDGLEPVGLSTLQPGSAPATTQIVPGGGQIAITAPNAGGQVEIEALDKDGVADTQVENIDAGATITVDAEATAVRITSQTPIVAAATDVADVRDAEDDSSSQPVGTRDTAAMPSVSSLRSDQLVALPVTDAELVFFSATDTEVTITPIDDDELGEPITQEITADTAVTVDVPSATGARIETTGADVYAGVHSENANGIGAVPVIAPDMGGTVPVRVGN